MSTEKPILIEHSFAVVPGPVREHNHRVLQPILTDLIAFSLNIKQLHWNVTGPHFRPIHLQLDEIYQDAQQFIDDVAERLTACGHSPLGTSTSVASDTELTDTTPGFHTGEQTLLQASHGTHALAALIRSRMETIESEDTVTADLLHQIVAKLEKHHWMLQAQKS